MQKERRLFQRRHNFWSYPLFYYIFFIGIKVDNSRNNGVLVVFSLYYKL